LEDWLNNPVILAHVTSLKENHADCDPIFTREMDEDFDNVADGISLKSFGRIFSNWIKHCLMERLKSNNHSTLTEDDWKVGTPLFNLCFCLSTLGRRCLVMDANNLSATNLFLQRYHALFKGDIRITSLKDEFILADVDIMQRVIARGLRMSLKLHQDHFINDEYEDLSILYAALEDYDKNLVCCHEGDPLWRQSILSEAQNLLSLRRHVDEHNPENNGHLVLQLMLRYMKFRAIKLNRESVRGLWAGQVQELTFLGNTNSERGSIQQLKTVVRNLVNQSCDFPVGYPVFVSPLTTSYSSFWPEMLKGKKLPSFLKLLWWDSKAFKISQAKSRTKTFPNDIIVN